MSDILDYPLLVFLLSFVALWLATWLGATLVRRLRRMDEETDEDLNVVVGATLTLLALIVGFSFSMAVSRYDQRKNLEEEEANAIGTEYVRADLLSAVEADRVRGLLRQYLEQRVQHYSFRDAQQARASDARTEALQAELWTAIVAPSLKDPTPVVALVVSGMNDVLNSQGYAQAAEWNRIPIAAWTLMWIIAASGCMLFGYASRRPKVSRRLFLVLPAVLSAAFLLIADIDSPHAGMIRVKPQNLASLAQSLRGH